MKVSDVMTRRVISISPDSTISQAIKLMLKHHISGLPVIDQKGKLVGLVTEGDFLRRPETGTEKRRSRWLDALFGPGDAAKVYVRSHGGTVRDVMSRKPITIKEDAALAVLVGLMESHNIKRLPVVRRGKVVGIVSRANLMRAVASLRHSVPTVSKSDAAIKERILKALSDQTWTEGALIDVTVRKGVVDLWGIISEVQQQPALNALVAGTPGVKRVDDHLRWQGETHPPP